MAVIVWPTIRAKYISGYRFRGGKSIHRELQRGGLHTTRLSTTARYWVTLTYHGLSTTKLAPVPYGTVSEAQAIRDCLIALDRGDTIQMADPVDGVLRTWALDQEQQEGGSYERMFEKDRAPFRLVVPLRSA